LKRAPHEFNVAHGEQILNWENDDWENDEGIQRSALSISANLIFSVCRSNIQAPIPSFLPLQPISKMALILFWLAAKSQQLEQQLNGLNADC
jgi:hypothetical protein